MPIKDKPYNWHGRVDAEDRNLDSRFHQVVETISNPVNSQGITLLGFASDLGVLHNQGRVGAAQGPIALRQAMSSLAWHFDTPLFDAGDIHIDMNMGKDPLANAQQGYANRVTQTLNNGQFTLGLGGGHEIAWGSYLGCRQYLDETQEQQAEIGIINFDAHFDLRKPPLNVDWVGSSGTPFYQIAQDCKNRQQDFHYFCLGINETANTTALFQFAEQNKVHYKYDYQCQTELDDSLLDDFFKKIDYLYLTICLDALPASIAPGVSAPASLGVPLPFIINTIHQLKQLCQQHNTQWLMADIAELNPKFDIDNQTAKVAARLAYELIKSHQFAIS